MRFLKYKEIKKWNDHLVLIASVIIGEVNQCSNAPIPKENMWKDMDTRPSMYRMVIDMFVADADGTRGEIQP